ncbi:helix-turn-helix domain-containing protein [Streptomyces gardneri]|uniref:helix-turn-helix domain-containing protein n=1 Tax=Streptomyces gardneri TaxID=66892 RepID=UPI0033DC1577
MPGWKALSDELDPDVRAFAERLRRLVDRSGLGVSAVAERTGHDRSAWDAYLGGSRPVPRNAVVALAEVTGADPGDLAAEWERAERAWARSDRREEALDRDGSDGADGSGGSGGSDGSDRSDGPRDDRTMQIRRLEPAPTATVDSPPPSPSPSPPPSPPRPRRTLLLYVTATLGALLVVTAALLLVDLGGTGDGTDDRAATPPSPTTPTAAPSTGLPAGVKCAGPGCTGRDPEAMGCGGPLATTVARTHVGTALVEVRHSETCAAAWARITGAAPGDIVTVKVAGATRRASVPEGADTDAYTPMLAVTAGPDATACATLADGSETCTAN